MKQHLLDLLAHDDWATRELLKTVSLLPDQAESLTLISHIIAAQDKWMGRITKTGDDSQSSWSGTVYGMNDITQAWAQSITAYKELVNKTDDAQLDQPVYFSRTTDSKQMVVKLKDIVLQICYHGMHHRAQINKLIRAQGIAPPTTDYILTVLKEA